MKIIFSFIFIFCLSAPFSASDIDSFHKLFQSNKIEDHVQALLRIKDNVMLYKGNATVIRLLINELEIDGINKSLFQADRDDYQLILLTVLHLFRKIGDDDNYHASLALSGYLKNIKIENIRNQPKLCMDIIDTLDAFTTDKPIEVSDYLGLISSFKIFTDTNVFSAEVTQYSKRKLLKIFEIAL